MYLNLDAYRSPVLDEVGQVLLDADAFLDRQGWGQGCSYNSLTERVCVSYALKWVAPSVESFVAAQVRLRAHLGLSPQKLTVIAAWNDTKGRTREEVRAALRGAAFADA
jgi:hypothetical protein